MILQNMYKREREGGEDDEIKNVSYNKCPHTSQSIGLTETILTFLQVD